MSHATVEPRLSATPPGCYGAYTIRVDGHLDSRCAEWFGNMAIAYLADGTTSLSGNLANKAALYEVLARVRDLGLRLLWVQRGPWPEQAGAGIMSEL